MQGRANHASKLRIPNVLQSGHQAASRIGVTPQRPPVMSARALYTKDNIYCLSECSVIDCEGLASEDPMKGVEYASQGSERRDADCDKQ